MEYTKSQLITDMEALGHPITPRRVTDWLEKGLLPPLISRGCGQGRGKRFFWSQRGVLRQALDVYTLLGWHNRVEAIRFPLWLLGHDQPLSDMRDRMMTRFTETMEFLKDKEKGLQLDDRISDLVWNAAGNPSAQHMAHGINVAGTLELALRTYLDPHFEIDEHAMADLSSALGIHIDLARFRFGSLAPIDLWRLMQNLLSVERLHESVVGLPDAGLLQVHQDLKLLGGAFRSIAKLTSDLDDAVLARVWVHLGSLLCPVDVALRHRGYGDWVDAQVRRTVELSNRIIADDELHARVKAHQAPSETRTK